MAAATSIRTLHDAAARIASAIVPSSSSSLQQLLQLSLQLPLRRCPRVAAAKCQRMQLPSCLCPRTWVMLLGLLERILKGKRLTVDLR